jgi:hypothetical protein
VETLDSLMRRWFPRQYCIRGRRGTERENKLKLKAAEHLSANDRWNLKQQLELDLWEWDDWLTEMDDERLVAKAAKMDIDLDDIPLPPSEEPERRPSHYVLTNYGNRCLHFQTRKALKARMRDRAPSYRRERREFWDLIVKAIPFVTGLIGTAIGLVAAIKK